jgi:hypothetical protein
MWLFHASRPVAAGIVGAGATAIKAPAAANDSAGAKRQVSQLPADATAVFQGLFCSTGSGANQPGGPFQPDPGSKIGRLAAYILNTGASARNCGYYAAAMSATKASVPQEER